MGYQKNGENCMLRTFTSCAAHQILYGSIVLEKLMVLMEEMEQACRVVVEKH